ncbi:MAG: helix-turn-helix domain-containing protein [Actinomycetota bacterium]
MPLPHASASALSDEQIAILLLVAQGHTDERISREIGISKSSVQRRLHHAAVTVGATSRLTLVLCAIERGLIERPHGPCDEANSSRQAAGTRPGKGESLTRNTRRPAR